MLYITVLYSRHSLNVRYIKGLYCIHYCVVGYSIVIKIVMIDTVMLLGTLLSLYLDKRRGVQGNTSMRWREFARPNAGMFVYSSTCVKVLTLPKGKLLFSSGGPVNLIHGH